MFGFLSPCVEAESFRDTDTTIWNKKMPPFSGLHGAKNIIAFIKSH